MGQRKNGNFKFLENLKNELEKRKVFEEEEREDERSGRRCVCLSAIELQSWKEETRDGEREKEVFKI